MRSAALATLLLSVSAGQTAAFAPPQPSSAAKPSTSTRLHNDLKSLLGEYNSADAAADVADAVAAAPAKPIVEKAARVVYEKVVEAPPAVTAPPPEKIVEAVVSAPPASPVGDATSNALDAMASYADSAQKAAEKASAAAAAISAK